MTSNSEDVSLTIYKELFKVILLLCLGHLVAGVPVLAVEGRQHALEVALVRQPGVIMRPKPDPLVVVVRLGALNMNDRAR